MPPGSPPHQPLPPPPPACPSGTSCSLGASGSSQVSPPPPPPSSTNQEGHLSHRPLKIYIWMIIWLPMHKYTRLLIKTFGMPIFSRHTSEGDCRAVKTHMQILSVFRIEVFSMYGYDYMKKIVLRRADLNERIITERDFKYLYPSDFEDLYLLNLQGHLNHLPPKDKKILTTVVNLWTRHLVIRQRVEDFQLGIESYQTQLNLTKPCWDATGFEYKHDYTVIDSSRVVTFWEKYGVQIIMQFNEIHKFSDGTLHLIDEALDYWVKEFKVNRMNPGLNIRFWTRKDVDRSKEFMFSIQKRLKTRRIFYNLESFIGRRVRDGD
nr:hypothetical protein [Tanacetum cinerariifolium]